MPEASRPLQEPNRDSKRRRVDGRVTAGEVTADPHPEKQPEGSTHGDSDTDGTTDEGPCAGKIMHISRVLVIEKGHLRTSHAADYVATPQAPVDPPTQAPHEDDDDDTPPLAPQPQPNNVQPKLLASPRSMKYFESPESETENLAANVIGYLSRTFAQQRFQHSAADREWLQRSMLTLSRAVVELSRSDPRKRGAVVHLRGPLFVLGDLHGDFEDMLFFMQRLTILGDIRFTPHGFLLLGDYVDRGAWGVEVCAYVMAMRCLSPGTVTLLRGNHDDPMVNSAVTEYAQSSFRYQCYAFCNKGREAGTQLHVACNKMFKALPLAAVVDDTLFCSHGGIPRYAGGVDDRLEVLQDPGFPELPVVYPRCLDPTRATLAEKQVLYAWDLMWSDPHDEDATPADTPNTHTEHGFGFNVRGGSCVSYNSTAVTTFLTNHGLSCLVRGHQERPAGARLSHNGRVLTLFSTSGYCGHSNNAAAVLFGADRTVSYITKSIG